MYIERILELPEDKHFFLFGPRQTGKSTLIKKRFNNRNALYYDLLKTDVYRKLLAAPEVFRQEIAAAMKGGGPSHVIIDEVQKIPQLLDEVHYLIESGSPCRFILSGSSSRKLKRCHANMLAGRAWNLHLHPFSIVELPGDFHLFSVLKYGTLPGVYLAEGEREKGEILRSYVNVYLGEEIEIEANVRNLSGFLRFLPMVAHQNGELVNYSNIARETGVTSHTVREYYKILEDTLMGFFLFPYGKSLRKKMAKHPKFYFFDPGVVTALTKRLRVDLQEGSYELGRVFEHFLILEIVRLNHYYRMDLELSFYRTEGGAEVDCIIETPSGPPVAVEIKSTVNPSSSMVKGLLSFKEKVVDAELILACRTDRPRLFKGVRVLPWRDVLDELCRRFG